MSGTTISYKDHPPHGHPDNRHATTQNADRDSTASHPPSTKPDPTTSSTLSSIKHNDNETSDVNSPEDSSRLASVKSRLQASIVTYPDWPKKGILFHDLLPIFANASLFNDLLTALEIQISSTFNSSPDVIVALEARGFLIGPALSARLNIPFIPIRKKGKLPGEVISQSYSKEYGDDFLELQTRVIKNGQKVLILDDLIATGGSAKAAGQLVKRAGGKVLGYVFVMELVNLKGRDTLDEPVCALLQYREEDDDVEAKEADKTKELPLGQTHESGEQRQSVQDAGGAAASTRP